MLENMVVGNPPGNYDRLLDFTYPATGTNFFAPSMQFLAELETAKLAPPLPIATAVGAVRSTVPVGDGSLGIGSLKGVPQHE
jgi:putative iron-dependent peroxidase